MKRFHWLVIAISMALITLCWWCVRAMTYVPDPSRMTVGEVLHVVDRYAKFYQYEKMAVFLESVDGNRLALLDSQQHPGIPRYLAVAEFDILIPGLSESRETDVVHGRLYVEIPGLGDDSNVPDRLRSRVFASAKRLASSFNACVEARNATSTQLGRIPPDRLDDDGPP